MMLQVSDLTIARGGIPVLEGLSFTLASGQALVVRGPNGIGKTTLLRTIAGLQPPVSGQVEVPPESLVYAGHSDGIKATLSVVENLKFWAEAFGSKDFSRAIEAFKLAPLAHRPAGELSAGQKRRLGLARLLVTGRALWVLDEPTVSLDKDAVAMFASAVRGHLAEGGMALIATHIDLGLNEARILDVGPYQAKPLADNDFDGAFL
ncbi:heme ABC exporter ATP-binding protein CcmA [Roseovarius sp.]|uniref:heme ABC exporter ATP-binding protein CcmA n=1 Tax=Roseovarius sp. TaxID=1486281 RepID=UPI003A984408